MLLFKLRRSRFSFVGDVIMMDWCCSLILLFVLSSLTSRSISILEDFFLLFLSFPKSNFHSSTKKSGYEKSYMNE